MNGQHVIWTGLLILRTKIMISDFGPNGYRVTPVLASLPIRGVLYASCSLILESYGENSLQTFTCK